jgi:hypothetical protein
MRELYNSGAQKRAQGIEIKKNRRCKMGRGVCIARAEGLSATARRVQIKVLAAHWLGGPCNQSNSVEVVADYRFYFISMVNCEPGQEAGSEVNDRC